MRDKSTAYLIITKIKMKKVILSALAAVGILTAQAQQAYQWPSFGDNWSIGLDGGVTTPLAKHHAFFGDMRGTAGLHVQTQVTPVFAFGFEGYWGVNTSSWFGREHRHVTFDNSYVGFYGGVNLMNLFGGYNCTGRKFDIEAVLGAGWGHDYANEQADQTGNKDYNYMVTKYGLNFNYNVNPNLTISLKPSIAWNMTGSIYSGFPEVKQTSVAYTSKLATFNCAVGVTYHFGPGFICADTKNQAEIDKLNAELNGLRAKIEACNAAAAAAKAENAAVVAELAACKNRKPVVVEKVSDNLQSVRYIFYKVGSSKITADQQPNVEMVASYLKNHKDAKVVVKGYASQDGNLEFNKKLAAARAESVKTALVKKYGIAADRITAVGEGIGSMFSENDWNRVSICTLEK